ncbi:CPK2 [Symbiodinium sp. CCMP2456]|nr:CPK2 [Symbiodinium sp. CCMP2456]
MSGGVPFGTEEEIKAARVPLGKQWCDASQEAVCFLRKLLSRPAHRPPAKLALQDPFFQKHLPKPEMPTLRFGLLDDLRTFRGQNKLKRSSLTTIASMLAEEHVQAARDMFISMDTDGDGLLCVAEVEKRLRKQREQGILEKDVTRREVERIFRDFDSSLAGSSKDFTYTEFLAATFNRKACLTDAVVQEAFKILDKNNDGSIDLDELSSGRMLGHIPIEELQQILEDMDQNGDKQIDLQEFKEMLWNADLMRANTTASLKTLTAGEALALCANEGTNNSSI